MLIKIISWSAQTKKLNLRNALNFEHGRFSPAQAVRNIVVAVKDIWFTTVLELLGTYGLASEPHVFR